MQVLESRDVGCAVQGFGQELEGLRCDHMRSFSWGLRERFRLIS